MALCMPLPDVAPGHHAYSLAGRAYVHPTQAAYTTGQKGVAKAPAGPCPAYADATVPRGPAAPATDHGGTPEALDALERVAMGARLVYRTGAASYVVVR